MAKGYWVANVDVHDLEEYKKYIAANAAAFEKFGGKFITRGGQQTVVEGEMHTRVVVIEFQDFQTAQACYTSPEYQAAMKFRLGHSDANLAIVEGWDG